jgi:Xaa-Pro dipeptidase
MSSTVTSSATPTESIFATQAGVARVQQALAESDLDGWLLCEYRGLNWIASSLLAVSGTTRRAFVLVPREGQPRLLLHAIEASAWRHWPWEREVYAGWREMEAKLAALVGGHGKLAMEVSPGSAVPTVDAVPWGMVEMLRGVGVEPVSSQDLISFFHSVWSEAQLVEHRRAAEIIAKVAHDGFRRAADAVRKGTPTTEGALNRWIVEEMASRGVGVDQDAHVAVGPGAADPHYAPAGEGRTIERDQVLLIDLWGRTSATAVAADQTWMGWVGERVPDEVGRVWDIVRDSRDAAVEFLKRQHAAGAEVRGFEVDDVSRAVIDSAGFGSYFVHRTGHSIDTRLHGSGPNLDNLESRDERRLLPGVGFSVEPGIYLPDRFGIRSEINVHWGAQGPEVTPQRIQTELPALLANG